MFDGECKIKIKRVVVFVILSFDLIVIVYCVSQLSRNVPTKISVKALSAKDSSGSRASSSTRKSPTAPKESKLTTPHLSSEYEKEWCRCRFSLPLKEVKEHRKQQKVRLEKDFE